MKQRLLRKSTIPMLILIVTTLLSGCGTKDDNTLNIGYFNNITHAQALYMKNQDILSDYISDEYNIEWTAFNAGPAEVEALFSGNIDIGYIGPVPAITANSKSNGDIQILTGATKGGSILVSSPTSNISSIEDLSGKNVAIPQLGNTQHLSLLDLLNQHNLAPTTENGDVTVSAISNADVYNVMERGDIDAALVPEPWGATLLSQGATMLLDYDQIYMQGQYDVAVVVVRKDFYQSHPDIVDAFLNAHMIATEQIKNNPDESYSIINTEINEATGKSLSSDILSDSFSRIIVDTNINREAMDGFATLCKEQGFISTIPSDNLYVNNN